MEKNLHFPITNYYNEGANVTVNSQLTLIDRGMDPKPMVLEFCKPHCVYWKEKLERCEHKLATIERCESKLATIIKINPTKTCMYPMRDYVTCVEACVSNPSHSPDFNRERRYCYSWIQVSPYLIGECPTSNTFYFFRPNRRSTTTW